MMENIRRWRDKFRPNAKPEMVLAGDIAVGDVLVHPLANGAAAFPGRTGTVVGVNRAVMDGVATTFLRVDPRGTEWGTKGIRRECYRDDVSLVVDRLSSTVVSSRAVKRALSSRGTPPIGPIGLNERAGHEEMLDAERSTMR